MSDLQQTVPDPESPLRAPSPEPVPTPLLGAHADDRVLLGHTYDGIREYDNPMPGWWVAVFWATVLFAPVYMLGVHSFGWIDSYGDDLAEEGRRLEGVREQYASTGPAFKSDAGALRAYAGDAGRAAVGAGVFTATCASCHGADGGGLIGPNLADGFWLHGAGPEAVWASINAGYPTAGMPAWKDQLSDDDRAGLLAYIASIQGTSPASPKPPQGEPGVF